jgi:hypothetical protein
VQKIPTIDLYRELEVDPAASSETIDAAWKSLLKRHHPDVASDSEATLQRVKRLNLAHEWLSDPAHRALYDRARRRPSVMVIPRPERPPEQGRGGRTAQTVSSSGSDANAGSDGSAGSWATGEPDSARSERADQEAAGGHNPYGEFGSPGRAAPGTGTASGPSVAPVHPARPRMTTFLAPLALASVLLAVAFSSLVASQRTPTVAVVATPAPAATLAVALASSPLGALASIVENPRGLPGPDLASALPAACRSGDVAQPLNFEVTTGGELTSGGGSALVYVVRCDATHSFGPLVYLPGTSAWTLEAKGHMVDGLAVQGFSGGLSGVSPDEFGIAWTHPASAPPADSTVSLYRLEPTGVVQFWDSSAIGLAWSLGKYRYEGAPDPAAAGSLAVVWADLGTGTRNCATCPDHTLYREVFAWGLVAGKSQLVGEGRQTVGIGLP